IFFTGPRSRKARNLRRDPRVAISLAPADNPFQPVIIRGRVTEWLEGDTAWETPATRHPASRSSRGQGAARAARLTLR
ncbi:MAG TPA: pyridoxamine 5'-phosphate oxidase family protein, partial [Trebonia sp.]|nr:pyridoxamine 5'-phosphate oxidase family protein [Trebonia sp.]